MRIPLVVAVVLAACGSHPPRAPEPTPPVPPTPPAPAPAPPPAPAPRPPDPYSTQLNLDFEQVVGDRLRVWEERPDGAAPAPRPGYELGRDPAAHGGAHSFRVRATGGGPFAAASATLDATPLRGKRLRLHGWIKTDGVTAPGWAALWLRADGGAQLAFDNMNGRGLLGTADWRQAMATIDVPADATEIVLGPMLVGAGTAWFDDLRLEVADAPGDGPIELAGVVLEPSGKPAAGATVTLMTPSARVTSIVRTDARGQFHVEARPGRWGISAHHPSGAGAFFDPRQLEESTADLRLALTAGGVRVRGHVTASAPLPAGAHVAIGPYSDHSTDVFALPIAADGGFEARLPAGDRYVGHIVGPGLVGTVDGPRTGDEAVLDLKVDVLGPPPAAVLDWVAKAAVPLASAEAGHGFADLAAVGAMVGKARIVGLGEATHGTREFFQLKHRLLEYLVAEQGFTVFALEANLPECRALDDYIRTGKGDPRKALDGIYFWTWNTEEVLAMIEWMRAWNADPRHKRKLRFVGIDMQTTAVAHANLVRFLGTVASSEVEALTASLAVFAAPQVSNAFAALAPDDRQAAVAGLAALATRFERSQAAWSKRAGKDAFLDAREDLRVIAQAAAMLASPQQGFELRDVAMADNLDGILARAPRGTRVVVWAHNGHVSSGMGDVINMGSHLRERHGKDYVVFGFVFGEGSFQALDWTRGPSGTLAEHTLGPPPAWDVSAPFRATGKPLVVVDLRAAPAGPVADWFAALHPMRDTGSVFTSEEDMSSPQALSRRYDAVLYVDRTTRARPNPGGQPRKPTP